MMLEEGLKHNQYFLDAIVDYIREVEGDDIFVPNA